MQCSFQEIEAKRRLAEEIRSRKNQTRDGGSPNFGKVFPSRQVRSSSSKPYEKPKTVVPFYGKTNTVTASCTLITEERFAVETSGYSSALIEVFKTVPSKCYNSERRTWDFSLTDYETLQNKVANLNPHVVIGKLPQFVLNSCRLPKPAYSEIKLGGIDRELLTSLMPFQEEGVRFGITKGGRCLIADEMGLGKTFQALAIASYYAEDFPILIATTASMKSTWEETIHQHMPSISIMHTQYMISAKDYIGDAKILIVSHDLMSRCVDKLLERNFRILIIDESHALKNFKAKCTKAATLLAKRANRVILLSGTPALSRPNELYQQLALIDEKFFGSFFEFSKRYCDGKSSAFGWDSNGQSNLKELEIILSKHFMIRRTKEGVLKMLPDKVQEVVRLDVNLNQFSASERENLKAFAANYVREKRSNEKHAALLGFFAESAKIKIPSVCSYILQMLEEQKKFIVFAHHKLMLDAIVKILVGKRRKFMRIDGQTTSEQRKTYIDQFQLDSECVCAVLSITAANSGITLTAARLVVFAELHWNPSILSQAESRAHRIGQEDKVTVKYLVAPGTVDDHIWPLLQNKQKILAQAGLFKETFHNLTVTKQESAGKINVPHSNLPKQTDITRYLTVSKIQDEFEDDGFNPSLVEEICDLAEKSIADNVEYEFLNDDLDDVLRKVVDFNEKLVNVEEELLNDDLDDVLASVVLNV